jgi:anti-anti-sigma factor
VKSRETIQLTVYSNPPALYARIDGSLNVLNYEASLRTLQALLKPPLEQFYIMMGALNYLDSAGLGVFVRLNTRCRLNQCALALLDPTPEVSRLLNLSKLDLIIPVLRGSEARRIRDSYEREELIVDPSAAQ